MTASMLILMTVIAADPADSAPNVTQPPALEEFLIIPLRVHILSATDLEEVDCALTDEDIARIVGKVNGIWNKAGVHFGLEPIIREAAIEQERFKELRDLAGGAQLDHFPMLAPTDTHEADAMHVYYVHRLPVNGVHYGGNTSFVQETASLRPVEGGIDEPLPRVTSHELGHALSLPHRQDNTNLMASGTTGTLLNEDEVKQAREVAKAFRGAKTFEELRQAAAAADDCKQPETVTRLRQWLSEISRADRE